MRKSNVSQLRGEREREKERERERERLCEIVCFGFLFFFFFLYLASLLAMCVFPLAGNPTMTMTCFSPTAPVSTGGGMI